MKNTFSSGHAGGEGFGGCFGLIATNTIGQGDTRSTGLRWICNHGGQIYQAQRRFKWPGQAAVVVSVVNVMKGDYAGTRILDNKPVQSITAFLFHRGSHDNPATLKANTGKSFVGSYVLGMGFTFDDTDTKGVANSIAEMHRLIEQNPKNAERIFPYIGGEEINTSPTHAHHRYVINFGDMTEDEARTGWPDLMKLVEEKVKPERMKLKDNSVGRKRAECWWQYGSSAKQLYAAIANLDRVLAIARVGQQGSFTFLSSLMTFSEQLIVFPLRGYDYFAILQSRSQEYWARTFSSSMKDDLRYTPSDCFETFPFPVDHFAPTTDNSQQSTDNYRRSLLHLPRRPHG